MKFSIAAQDLKRALNTCNEIAPVSSSIAEEKTGVLIRAGEERVLFTSSDETLGTRVEVSTKVIEPGEALVKCAPIAAWASSTFADFGYDGDPTFVTLETTSKATLKVSGGYRVREGKTLKHRNNLPLLNSSFFIETPPFNETKATQFPVFQFMDGFAKVSPAASKDTSKLNFNCILVSLTDDEVIFAATDGIQIAEFRKAAEVQGLRGSFILGLKFASVATKLVNPTFDVVDLYVDNDRFFLKSGGTVLVGALINSKFPDYEPYLQPDGLKRAIFPYEDFMLFLQSTQPAVDAKSHRLVVNAYSKGTATVSTSSISGEAESSDMDVTTPEDFTLHFDSMLLQNAIRQLKGEEFEFYFSEGAKGVLLKSNKDDDFKTYVCTLKQDDR